MYPTRKSTIRLVTLATAGTLAIALSGCSSSSSTGSDSDQKSIAFVIKPLDNTYFGAMAQGAKAEAKKQGVKLTVIAADNVNDDSGQASKLNSLVSAGGYGCFVVNPTSQTNLINPLVKVSQAKTPIVNLDLPIDTKAAKAANVKITSYVGTDNETAGAAGGTAMLKLLSEGDTVAPIGGVAGDPGSIARIKGFSQKVDGKLKVLSTVAGNADEATAKSAAAGILRQNPDVKGFFTVAGVMALGIQQAVNEAGLQGKVAVVGVDGTEDQLKDIVAGGEPAAIEQFPYLMGQQSVQACVAAMKGTKIPANVNTPVLIVDKSNAADALKSFPAPPSSFTVPNPFN